MCEPADRAELQRQAREIVVERLRRLPAGQALPEDELLQQHPELAAELRAVLREHERLVAVLGASRAAEYEDTPDNGGITLDVPPHPRGRLASAERITIGKYEVMSRISRGGQAEVFQAFDPAVPGRIVAIKWFFETLSPQDLSAWQRDVMPCTKIDEPGMVRLYDADVCNQRPYLVFEFVEGVPPKVAVDQSRTPMRRAAEILADAAGIVARLHAHGIRHADLKPANLLVDVRGRVRILDFGLSSWDRIGVPSVERASSGPIGTPQYMAPEQARAEAGPVDHRTDVFGLGAVGYTLVTGRAPYDRKTLVEVLELARRAECPPPRRSEPRVPRTLDRIIRKAMCADPARRYSTAAELERALRRYLLVTDRRWLVACAALLLVGISVAVLAAVRGAAPTPVDPLQVTHAEAGSAPTAAGTSGAADADATEPSAPAAVPAALDGTLTIRVWNEAPEMRKWGIAVGEPGAVPVRSGELVQLHVELNAPAYLYLLWIGSDGKPQPLHPAAGADAAPIRELRLPDQANRGMPVYGSPGVETAIMIAAHRPLDSALWDSLPAEFPLPATFEPSDVVWVELKRPSRRPTVRAQSRSLGTDSQPLGEPLLDFLERLRPHAELIQAIRFGHVE